LLKTRAEIDHFGVGVSPSAIILYHAIGTGVYIKAGG
jgi:hypothetical protein